MQDRSAIEEQIQSTFGRYQPLRRVGRGGMGEIWLCEDSLLHRQVAVKTLPPHNQQDQDYMVRFEREARAAAALNHPHILAVHDYGTQVLPGGELTSYLVMPYIPGGSLADLMKQLASQRQGMGQDLALLYLTQAASAIDFAHAQGMVHRDIKPANMLLRADDWLLLSDFGIVRMLAHDGAATGANEIVGTPIYMAPEQAQGHAEAASDNYSLAVLAYQLLTGRPPFEAESTYAIMVQHVLNPPPPPRQFFPELPEACDEVLLRGLAKAPAERYPSAQAFVDALKGALGVKVTAPEVLAPASRWQNMTPRRKVLAGSAAGLVAVGAGVGAWSLAASRKPAVRATSQAEQPAMVLRDHLAPPPVLTWMPNKNVLISAGPDAALDVVKLWDIDSLRYRQLPEYESTHSVNSKGGVAFISCSPDARYLAISGTHDDDISFKTSYIDIYQPDLSIVPAFQARMPIPSINVEGLAWLQDRYIVAIWPGQDAATNYFLGMWDVTRPTLNLPPLSVPGFHDPGSFSNKNNAFAPAPDGRRFALGTDKGVIIGATELLDNKIAWRADRTPLVRNNSAFGVGSVQCWSADGSRIIGLADEGALNIVLGWNIASQSGDTMLRFGIPADAEDFTVIATHPSKAQKMFAAGTKDGKIYLWSGEPRKLPFRTLIAQDIHVPVLALAWSPGGQWLAASYSDNDATILIWKI